MEHRCRHMERVAGLLPGRWQAVQAAQQGGGRGFVLTAVEAAAARCHVPAGVIPAAASRRMWVMVLLWSLQLGVQGRSHRGQVPPARAQARGGGQQGLGAVTRQGVGAQQIAAGAVALPACCACCAC